MRSWPALAVLVSCVCSAQRRLPHPVLRRSDRGRSSVRLFRALDPGIPGGQGWIWKVASPTVGLGLAWQQSRYYEGDVRVGGTVNRWGHELVLADVLSLRHGTVDDEAGTIEDDTLGFGVRLAYRNALGVRFDWAQVPQSEFLDEDVERRAVTAFVDPVRLWRELR